MLKEQIEPVACDHAVGLDVLRELEVLKMLNDYQVNLEGNLQKYELVEVLWMDYSYAVLELGPVARFCAKPAGGENPR